MSGFGGKSGEYQTSESRALTSITQSPGPDVNTDFTRMMQRHDAQIKFLASQLQQAQKGIAEANQNPIQQLQQFIADLVVLFGGGEIPKGALDFGDLKYIVPALGALFGFDDGPFPVNLFAAAEKFFLGYVIPGEQFTDLINSVILTLGQQLGIDPEFLRDVMALNTAIGDFANAIKELLDAIALFVQDLFTPPEVDLNPIAQLLAPVFKIFDCADLRKVGTGISWITDAVDPVIRGITNWINGFTLAITALTATIHDLESDVVAYIHDQFASIDNGIVQLLLWAASLIGINLPAPTVDGTELAPPINGATADWQIDNNPSYAWVYDPNTSYGDSGLGSFYTTGNSAEKRVLNQTRIACFPGQTVVARSRFQWSNVPLSGGFGAIVVFYQGSEELSEVRIPAPDNRDTTSLDWTLIKKTVMTPAGADGLRVGAYIDATATAGTVHAGVISLRNWTIISQDAIDSLINYFNDLPNLLVEFEWNARGLVAALWDGTVRKWFADNPMMLRIVNDLEKIVDLFVAPLLVESWQDAFTALLDLMNLVVEDISAIPNTLTDFIMGMFSWMDERSRGDLYNILRLPFHLLDIQVWGDAFNALWDLLDWLTSSVEDLWDQILDWLLAQFMPWLDEQYRTDIKAILRWPFHLLDPSAWIDGITAVGHLIGWVVGELTGNMGEFFSALVDLVGQWLSGLLDWVAYPLLVAFGQNPTPTVDGATWTPTTTLLHLITGESTPDQSFLQIPNTLINGLTDAIHSVVDGVEDNLSNGIANMLFVLFPQLKTQVPPGKTAEWWASQSDWDKASYVLSHVGDFVFSVGQSFVDGLTGALSDLGDGIDAAANSFATFLLGLLSVPAGYEPSLPAYERLGKFLVSHLFDWITWPVCLIMGIPVDTANGQSATEALLARMFGAGASGGVPGAAAAVSGFTGVFGLSLIPTLPPSQVPLLQQWVGYAEDATETLSERVDHAETVTIPALDSRISHAEDVTIPALDSRISHAEDVTIPALDSRIGHAEDVTIPALDSRISHAEDVTIPALDSRIGHAEDVTIPALEEGIDHANTAIADMHSAILAGQGGPLESRPDGVDDTGYSDIINAGKALQSIAQAGQTLGMNTAAVLAERDDEPLYLGMDGTAVATFPLPWAGANAPFFVITPGAWQAGFFRVRRDTDVNTLSWQGHGTDFTSFWVAVVRLDSHGNVTEVYVSPDLMVEDDQGHTGVDTDPVNNAWNVHPLPQTLTLQTSAVYGLAFRIDGGESAAYEMVGQPSWLTDHPYIVPRTPGMTWAAGAGSPGYAEDSHQTNDLGALSGASSVVGAGENRVLVSSPSGAAASLVLDESGTVVGTQTIDLVDTSNGLLGLFADGYASLYEVMDSPGRTSHRVTVDGLVSSMDAAVSDPTGVLFPGEDEFPGEDVFPTMPKSRLGFDLGGLETTPDGRVLVFDNDLSQLLVLDFNTGATTQYQFDTSIDDVIAVKMVDSGSHLLMLNRSTSEIIQVTIGDFAATMTVVDFPTGWAPTGLAAGADAGFALVLVEKVGVGSVLARVDLATGVVEFVSDTPTVEPADEDAVLVAGSAVAAINTGTDIAALRDGDLVVHRNVHRYNLADSDVTSREPVPWGSLSLRTDDGVVPRYERAVLHGDTLVAVTARRQPIPAWVNTVFLIGVGGGGGGGGYIAGAPEGFGGEGGRIVVQAVYRGVHFSTGDDLWASIGAGGAGGYPGAAVGGDGLPGGNGGATRINIGSTLDAVIAQGGRGGDGASATHYSLRVPVGQDAPDPALLAWGRAAGDNNHLVDVDGFWGLDRLPQPVVVAGQAIMVAGGVYRAAGGAPGGGGCGALHVPGGTGYGWPGASGFAWAVFSQRIVANA